MIIQHNVRYDEQNIEITAQIDSWKSIIFYKKMWFHLPRGYNESSRHSLGVLAAWSCNYLESYSLNPEEGGDFFVESFAANKNPLDIVEGVMFSEWNVNAHWVFLQHYN